MARYLQRCRSVVQECERLMSSDNVNDDTRRFVTGRLQSVKTSIQRSSGTLVDDEIATDLLTSFDEALANVAVADNDAVQHNDYADRAYAAPRNQQQRGAPKYYISREQLIFLCECGFSINDMGCILGVSYSTVQRRLREYNIALPEYSDVTAADLDRLVQTITRGNNMLGPNAVQARLTGMGYKVQRSRVRESVLRVDPEGVAERAMRPHFHRRRYTVAGPNSLWHIDGNHKLIRWRIVIHGGIDGFSRLFVYLNASDNNLAETVLGCFAKAVAMYGLPSRVRCDCGGENNDVCRLMEVVRGGGRGSALRGRSTHNQRIERSWVDTWCGVSNLYYDLFSFLESDGTLNVDNEVQIWALHYIFLPRINRDLGLFTSQWNNHGLRTEEHQTPLQLYVRNILQLQLSNLTAVQEIFGTPEVEDVPLPHGLDLENLVQVPTTRPPVSAEQLLQLQEEIDPLDHADDLGIDLYIRTIAFINNIVNH